MGKTGHGRTDRIVKTSCSLARALYVCVLVVCGVWCVRITGVEKKKNKVFRTLDWPACFERIPSSPAPSEGRACRSHSRMLPPWRPSLSLSRIRSVGVMALFRTCGTLCLLLRLSSPSQNDKWNGQGKGEEKQIMGFGEFFPFVSLFFCDLKRTKEHSHQTHERSKKQESKLPLSLAFPRPSPPCQSLCRAL